MNILAFGTAAQDLEQIEPVARQNGLALHGVTHTEQVSGFGLGAELDLIEAVSRLQPVLLLFSLNETGLPWRQWLTWLRTSAATRRIPVVCFGGQDSAWELARRLGVEAVLAREDFWPALSDVLRRYAVSETSRELQAACEQKLSLVAWRGIQAFNQGQYFEAHEALETAWREEAGAGRNLALAILQVAVAYLQIERCNYWGAVKMFQRLRQWIGPLPDRCRGVEVGVLRRQVEEAYRAVLDLGPDGLQRFDRRLLRPVQVEWASEAEGLPIEMKPDWMEVER